MPASPALRQRGVSLIEALVAMAVMAFGMLGIVGVQATLRFNGDVAKQRSEALRLGQRAIEDARSFSRLPVVAGVNDYADIASDSNDVADTGATNTKYTVERLVDTSTDPRMKGLHVVVSWTDRTGTTTQQKVELASVVAGVPPDLAATLLLAANVDANGVSTQSPLRRHRAVPLGAVQIRADSGSSDYSAYVPRNDGGYALLFDNLTGVVKLCETTAATTAGLTATNVTNCSSAPAQFLSGTVIFDYRIPQTAATAEAPTGDALELDIAVTLTTTPVDARGSVCFDDWMAGRDLVNYSCVVFSDAAGEWSGTSRVVAIGGWTIGAGAGGFKVCRYTTDDSDVLPNPNPQHPLAYDRVRSKEVLTNQNFLVIQAAATCPSDTAADPAAGNFVNSNTRQHQP